MPDAPDPLPIYLEPWARGEIEPECVVYRNGTVAHRPGSGPSFTDDELDRIVACVNACAGIPTEHLSFRLAAIILEAALKNRR